MAEAVTKLSTLGFPHSKEQIQREMKLEGWDEEGGAAGGEPFLPGSHLAHSVHRFFLKSGSIYAQDSRHRSEESANLVTPCTLEGLLLLPA